MATISKITIGSTTYDVNDAAKLPLAGGTMTGPVDFGSGVLTSTLYSHFYHHLYSNNVYEHFYPYDHTMTTATAAHFRTCNGGGSYSEITFDGTGNVAAPGGITINEFTIKKTGTGILTIE